MSAHSIALFNVDDTRRYGVLTLKNSILYSPRLSDRDNSALAQLVEQMTVNHWVAGSSPAGGAKHSSSSKGLRKCSLFYWVPINWAPTKRRD